MAETSELIELKEALRGLQWARYHEDRGWCCPHCGAPKWLGEHDDKCTLWPLIAYQQGE